MTNNEQTATRVN